jgi:hypothetical protein
MLTPGEFLPQFFASSCCAAAYESRTRPKNADRASPKTVRDFVIDPSIVARSESNWLGDEKIGIWAAFSNSMQVFGKSYRV